MNQKEVLVMKRMSKIFSVVVVLSLFMSMLVGITPARAEGNTEYSQETYDLENDNTITFADSAHGFVYNKDVTVIPDRTRSGKKVIGAELPMNDDEYCATIKFKTGDCDVYYGDDSYREYRTIIAPKGSKAYQQAFDGGYFVTDREDTHLTRTKMTVYCCKKNKAYNDVFWNAYPLKLISSPKLLVDWSVDNEKIVEIADGGHLGSSYYYDFPKDKKKGKPIRSTYVKVVPKKKGKTTITAEVDGKKYTCEVTVKYFTEKSEIKRIKKLLKYAPNDFVKVYTVLDNIGGMNQKQFKWTNEVLAEKSGVCTDYVKARCTVFNELGIPCHKVDLHNGETLGNIGSAGHCVAYIKVYGKWYIVDWDAPYGVDDITKEYFKGTPKKKVALRELKTISKKGKFGRNADYVNSITCGTWYNKIYRDVRKGISYRLAENSYDECAKGVYDAPTTAYIQNKYGERVFPMYYDKLNEEHNRESW